MFKGIYPDISPGPILQWARRLVRSIQLHISADRVMNTSGGILLRGQIVRYTGGSHEVALVDCSAATGDVPSSRAVGVMTEDTPDVTVDADNCHGIMRTDDDAYVLFEAGLVAPAPAAGQAAWCSVTSPGLATNVQPGEGFAVKIGTISDATAYVATGPYACRVLLKPCCEPVEVEPL